MKHLIDDLGNIQTLIEQTDSIELDGGEVWQVVKVYSYDKAKNELTVLEKERLVFDSEDERLKYWQELPVVELNNPITVYP